MTIRKIKRKLKKDGYYRVDNFHKFQKKTIDNLLKKYSFKLEDKDSSPLIRAYINNGDVALANVKRKFLKMFKNYKLSHAIIFKNLPDNREITNYGAHIDYYPLCDYKDSQIPLQVIIGLQDDTKLAVWKGSNNLIKYENYPRRKIYKSTIYYDKSDAVIWRSDTVHAGCVYRKMNYRLFLSFFPKNMDLPYEKRDDGGHKTALKRVGKFIAEYNYNKYNSS